MGYTLYDYLGTSYTLPYVAYYRLYVLLIALIGYIARGLLEHHRELIYEIPVFKKEKEWNKNST